MVYGLILTAEQAKNGSMGRVNQRRCLEAIRLHEEGKIKEVFVLTCQRRRGKPWLHDLIADCLRRAGVPIKCKPLAENNTEEFNLAMRLLREMGSNLSVQLIS